MTNLQEWLKKGENVNEAIANCIQMNEELTINRFTDPTDNSDIVKTHILWSGGAVPCIILAAVLKNEFASMGHYTPEDTINGAEYLLKKFESNIPLKFRTQKNIKYYIATDTLDGINEKICNKIKQIVSGKGAVIEMFKSKELAVDFMTGFVSTSFEKKNLPKKTGK